MAVPARIDAPTSPLSSLGEQGKAVKSHSASYHAMRRFLRNRLALTGLIVVILLCILGFGAPWLAPTSYRYANLMSANQFPSQEFPMGTDTIGHNYLSRIMYGTRTSLIVGFAAVAVACAIGIPLGLIAGLRGGWADFAVMRVVEIMTAFPGLLFALFLMSVFGGGLGTIVIVIGITSWLTLCRLMRAQLLSLREQEFVTAARSAGATDSQIAIRHLLPNAIAPIIVAISLAIPAAIFAEAGLSFLGLGINEPTPSLGKMVSDSAPYIRVYWHLGMFPTAAIALIMLGFSFVGDGLRDALDPRQV